jgi:hypothetical protein
MQTAAFTPVWESITLRYKSLRGSSTTQAMAVLRGRLATGLEDGEDWTRNWRRASSRRAPSAMERQIWLSGIWSNSAICFAYSGANWRKPRDKREIVALDTGGSSRRPKSMSSHPRTSHKSRRDGSIIASSKSDGIVTPSFWPLVCGKEGGLVNFLPNDPQDIKELIGNQLTEGKTGGYNQCGKLRLPQDTTGRRASGPVKNNASPSFPTSGSALAKFESAVVMEEPAKRTADEHFQKEKGSRRIGVFCLNYRAQRNGCQAPQRRATGEATAGHGQQREKSNEGTLQPIGVGQRTLTAITARLGKEVTPSQDLPSCPPRRSIVQ